MHATSQLDTHTVHSFLWAMESEKTHGCMKTRSVATTEAGPGWTNEQVDFYVCTLCGYTAKSQEAENCPACNFV